MPFNSKIFIHFIYLFIYLFIIYLFFFKFIFVMQHFAKPRKKIIKFTSKLKHQLNSPLHWMLGWHAFSKACIALFTCSINRSSKWSCHMLKHMILHIMLSVLRYFHVYLLSNQQSNVNIVLIDLNTDIKAYTHYDGNAYEKNSLVEIPVVINCLLWS